MDEISADQLIAAARDEGHPVTQHRLRRWRTAGLLPQSRRVYGAGIRGSQAMYPPETPAQLVALCQLHDQRKKLDEVGFELWWEGFAVRCDVRAFIDASMPWPDDVRTLRAGYRSLQTQHPGMAPEDLAATQVLNQRVLPTTRSVHRDSAAWQDLLAGMTLVMTLMMGRSPELETVVAPTNEPSPSELLVKLFGLAPATTQRVGEAGPWLGDPEGVFRHAAEAMRAKGFTGLASMKGAVLTATDEELAVARDDAHHLVDVVPAVLRQAEGSHGENPAGLGFLGWFGAVSTAAERARTVAACLTWRRLAGDAVDGFYRAFGVTPASP